ncbi:DNA mismatch repair endonuclease MutL [Heliobacillus mobilis]
MGVIRLLDTHTVNQIAAGEVVERPASIVKELMENALDAGATRIDVHLTDGGRQLIRIVDNGCGMSPEDAALCIERHATSKIGSAEDLMAIETLGFRGEALPSIASVSRMEFTTRRHCDSQGTRLRVEGGERQPVETVGAPPGTTIQVEDLFYNTPARRKFLRSSTAEGSACAEVIWRLALAHPHVAVSLTQGRQVTFRSPGNNKTLETLSAVYGREVIPHLLALSHKSSEGWELNGFIGEPSLNRANRNHQTWFINQRWVRSRSLSLAVEEVYQGLLPVHRFPFFVLNLLLPPHKVDVNAHPTKQEIKIDQERDICEFIQSVLKETLRSRALSRPLWTREGSSQPALSSAYNSQSSLTPDKTIKDRPSLNNVAKMTPLWTDSIEPSPKPETSGVYQEPNRGRSDAIIGERVQKNTGDSPEKSTDHNGLEAATNTINDITKTDSKEISKGLFDKTSYPSPQYCVETESPEKYPGNTIVAESLPCSEDLPKSPLYDVPLKAAMVAEWIPIGQFQRSYILAEGQGALYLIDQHAAHERVLYYALKEKLEQAIDVEQSCQQLLIPVTVTLTPAEFDAVIERISDLRDAGIIMEHFGGNTLLIRAVPLGLPPGEEEGLLRDIIDRIQGGAKLKKEDLCREALSSLACRGAVKAGQTMSHPEMVALLQQVARLEGMDTCPHGRPYLLRIDRSELEHRFHRS